MARGAWWHTKPFPAKSGHPIVDYFSRKSLFTEVCEATCSDGVPINLGNLLLAGFKVERCIFNQAHLVLNFRNFIMLTDDVLDYVHRSVLCWLATVDSGGFPNVSPKEVYAAFDRQTLVIANIASPNSVRNLSDNSRVCVSFIDVFAKGI